MAGTGEQGGAGRAAARGRGPALGADGLVFVSSLYAVDDRGRHVFAGERPAADADGIWHGHGYTDSRPWTLRRGRFVRIRVRKHRWKHAVSGRTRTSQPPDAVPRRHVDALVIATTLLGMLTAPLGVHSRAPDAPGVRSVRQLQRDLHAACELAPRTQQAVRLALMNRCVPRPVETLWEAGLDPPQELARRCRHPSAPLIWTALEMLRTGAEQLGTPLSSLLAEARRRWTGPKHRFLI